MGDPIDATKKSRCGRCGGARGTNPGCPTCDARRRAARRRMALKREGDRRKGLCGVGACTDPPEDGYKSCRVHRLKGRQRGRTHRLKQLPY